MYSLWKETTHKPSNAAAITKLFSSVYVIGWYLGTCKVSSTNLILWLLGAVAQRCSVKKVFLDRNLTKFTGKHLCQSLFFNKVAALRPATLLKKRL